MYLKLDVEFVGTGSSQTANKEDTYDELQEVPVVEEHSYGLVALSRSRRNTVLVRGRARRYTPGLTRDVVRQQVPPTYTSEQVDVVFRRAQ